MFRKRDWIYPTPLVIVTFAPKLSDLILKQSHIVPEGTDEIRLYDYVGSVFTEIPSRSAIKKSITRGKILVDGEPAKTGTWVRPGQKIELMDLEETPPKQFNLDFKIEFQDEHFAIVHKPAGIPVSGNQFKTMQNALVGKFSKSTEVDALEWPKPVHRLDSATSGLLIVAKTGRSLMLLGQMFEHKEIQKKYCAVVQGKMEEEGQIKFQIDEKKAETNYALVETTPSLRSNYLSLVDLYPKTGRTHQLRIHLSKLGFPIMGDTLYGREGEVLKGKGLFLCAIGLRFKHPITDEEIIVQIDEPSKFESLMEREKKRFDKYHNNTENTEKEN